MAHDPNPVDFSLSFADFIAQSVSDGTWSDVLVTEKEDRTATPATGIRRRTGQLWGNLVDSFIARVWEMFEGVEAVADREATAMRHGVMVSAAKSRPQPGVGPNPALAGIVQGLEFAAGEVAYKVRRIPSTFVSDASFHIHWTKSTDANEAGNSVRWRIRYVVFDGFSDDLAVTPIELVTDSEYTDSGTTSRIGLVTEDLPAVFEAGHYLGMAVDFVDESTTLQGNPLLIGADVVMRERINA
jgi:hypothetical protein